jgi:hypothetical protein
VKRLHARHRALFTGGVCAALVLVCLAGVLGAVPHASANAGDPDWTHSTWAFVSGSSGPILVTVTGTWSWGDNGLPGGGADSQSCATGNTVSSTGMPGHEALGMTVSWDDASTPHVLTGTAKNGTPVTLHVGDAMDWMNADYCAGTTKADPYPSGSYTATHQYSSYAAFFAATGGRMCANAYDIHFIAKAADNDPVTNTDSTLHRGHYRLSRDCATTGPPNHPGLSFKKLERIGSTGAFVRGRVTGVVGDTVRYEMLAANTGDTTLTVALVDSRCDAGTITPAGPVVLSPGGAATFTCSHKLVARDRPDFVNTATATAGAITDSSSVKVLVRSSGVKGKKIVKKAKPAHPVVKAANFTG